MPSESSTFARALALFHGAYYAITGVWPLVSLSTFLVITGDKTDTWLVQTVGVLVLAIAIPLLVAGFRRAVGLEVQVLGLGSAAAFLLVDVVFFLQGHIGAIYLADAVLEAMLVLAWAATIIIERNRRRHASTHSAETPRASGRTLF